MAIIKIKKERNFTTLTNQVLQNKELSFAAKGLLCELLSLPEDWVVHMATFTRSNCGIDKIRTLFTELRQEGYVEVIKTRESGKFIRTEWVVYENNGKSNEMPTKTLAQPCHGKPRRGNPMLQKKHNKDNININIKEINKEKIAVLKTERLINGKPLSFFYEKVPLLFNSIVAQSGSVPQMREITKTRQSVIANRTKDTFKSLEGWRLYFEWLAASTFLMEECNGRGFDFYTRPKIIVKIKEGSYHEEGSFYKEENHEVS